MMDGKINPAGGRKLGEAALNPAEHNRDRFQPALKKTSKAA